MSTEAEEKLAALEFMGPILEAQIKFDQSITNSLLEQAWEAAEEWATRFEALFYAVEKANDSIRVGRILDAHWPGRMRETIDHYRRMRGAEMEAIA